MPVMLSENPKGISIIIYIIRISEIKTVQLAYDLVDRHAKNKKWYNNYRNIPHKKGIKKTNNNNS